MQAETLRCKRGLIAISGRLSRRELQSQRACSSLTLIQQLGVRDVTATLALPLGAVNFLNCSAAHAHAAPPRPVTRQLNLRVVVMSMSR